jgi:hypothetical protein
MVNISPSISRVPVSCSAASTTGAEPAATIVVGHGTGRGFIASFEEAAARFRVLEMVVDRGIEKIELELREKVGEHFGRKGERQEVGAYSYQSNPIQARIIPKIKKAIKIQTPVDLKKDSSLSSLRRHSRRPHWLRQQVTLWLC